MNHLFQRLQDMRTNKGFTLLLAALVASIVLSLGAAIYSIAKKQVELSAIGRDSQFAFYAADSAAECALYWDSRTDEHPSPFATSSTSNLNSPSLKCDNQTVTVTLAASDSSNATSTFIYAPNGYCAAVEVSKHTDASGALISSVRADGYSTKISAAQIAANQESTLCDPTQTGNAISSDQNALQRSVELHY